MLWSAERSRISQIFEAEKQIVIVDVRVKRGPLFFVIPANQEHDPQLPKIRRYAAPALSEIGFDGKVEMLPASHIRRPAADDPLIRDRIMELVVQEMGLAQNQRRARVSALQDHPARLLLQNKLVASEIAQATGALAVEVEGASASLYLGDANAPAGGQWPMAYMNSYGMTIAAGTSEVQRNILGERVLGLAKSK